MLLCSLFMEKEMKAESSRELESPHCSASNLQCCDFTWPENTDEDRMLCGCPWTSGVKITAWAFYSSCSYYDGLQKINK